jgi:hypothetical protein
MPHHAHQEPNVLRLKRLGIDTYREPVIYMAADCPAHAGVRPMYCGCERDPSVSSDAAQLLAAQLDVPLEVESVPEPTPIYAPVPGAVVLDAIVLSDPSIDGGSARGAGFRGGIAVREQRGDDRKESLDSKRTAKRDEGRARIDPISALRAD